MSPEDKLPDDFIFNMNGFPVSIKELEAWKPGCTTTMGIVELMEWLPVYMGWSEEPVCISELKPDFAFVALPKPEDPEYPMWEVMHKCEDELIKAITVKNEFVERMDLNNPDDSIQEAVLADLVEEKRLAYIEADKKYSMISKLSDNSGKNSK